MAKNGYDQTYEDDARENKETADLIPKAVNKVKEGAKAAWDYANTHSLKDMYDSMDQRSLKDVWEGKPPVYKDTVKKAKGGFIDHKDAMKKHSAGFKPHHEHVKAMCGGGKVKK